MISFEYGFIRAGEVVVEASKTEGVNGIKLLGAIHRAIELSEHPLLQHLQCSGKLECDMTADEFVQMACFHTPSPKKEGEPRIDPYEAWRHKVEKLLCVIEELLPLIERWSVCSDLPPPVNHARAMVIEYRKQYPKSSSPQSPSGVAKRS